MTALPSVAAQTAVTTVGVFGQLAVHWVVSLSMSKFSSPPTVASVGCEPRFCPTERAYSGLMIRSRLAAELNAVPAPSPKLKPG